jgi:hypothetical protein
MPKNLVVDKKGSSAKVFQPIADAIHRVVSFPVSIWAPDAANSQLSIVASVGLPESYTSKAILSIGQTSVTGDAYKSGKIQRVRKIGAEPRWIFKQEAKDMNWNSAICVPIKADGVSIGVISVYTYNETPSALIGTQMAEFQSRPMAFQSG